MFTGLVESVGTVRSRERRDGGVSFVVSTPLGRELSEGESISIDGACLTVTTADGDGFGVTAVRSTLSRTTLGEYGEGRRVNLERAMRLGERLGGHLVQGHVDGVGEVAAVEPAGESVFLRIRLPEEVARVTIVHGSLAVDGVSLTVQDLASAEGGVTVAEVAIIPYTWERTALDRLSPGARVNLEGDVMGKYVERLLGPYLQGASGRGRWAVDTDPESS